MNGKSNIHGHVMSTREGEGGLRVIICFMFVFCCFTDTSSALTSTELHKLCDVIDGLHNRVSKKIPQSNWVGRATILS